MTARRIESVGAVMQLGTPTDACKSLDWAVVSESLVAEDLFAFAIGTFVVDSPECIDFGVDSTVGVGFEVVGGFADEFANAMFGQSAARSFGDGRGRGCFEHATYSEQDSTVLLVVPDLNEYSAFDPIIFAAGPPASAIVALREVGSSALPLDVAVPTGVLSLVSSSPPHQSSQTNHAHQH